MKVKDILEQLKNVNPETEIQFRILDGCCGDFELLENTQLHAFAFGGGESVVFFESDPLPGYTSCIKAAQMDKLAKELEKG